MGYGGRRESCSQEEDDEAMAKTPNNNNLINYSNINNNISNNNNRNSNRVLLNHNGRPTTLKKVQVVYYLSRNDGHLDHPHYLELTLLPHRHLLLKDVMERLTVLRGRGMPSLYSWSCKRSYKNGYVWNDLGENDVIYPCEGLEYVLKGSQIIQPSSTAEKFQLVQPAGNSRRYELARNYSDEAGEEEYQSKRKSVASKRHPEPPEEVQNNHYDDNDEEEVCEEKISYSSSATPRGVVCTDENRLNNNNARGKIKNGESTRIESTRHDSSGKGSASLSKRFEDDDELEQPESLLSRNSVLFQLIACGGSALKKQSGAQNISIKQGKNSGPPQLTKEQQMSAAVGRKSCSGNSLQKVVVIRAAAAATVKGLGTEDEEEIKYMSENPRFGNMQSEEKEYFSGSIVDSITTEERAVKVESIPSLKKSNSYGEERSCKAGGLGVGVEAEEEVKKKRGKSEKGKCIPIIKSSSKQSRK